MVQHKLVIDNPEAKDFIIGLVANYNGENLLKDFSKLLKSMIYDNYIILLKDYKTFECIIILSEKYKVTEKFIRNSIYS